MDCKGNTYTEDMQSGDRICTGCGRVCAEKLVDYDRGEKRDFNSDHTTVGSISNSRTQQLNQHFSNTQQWSTTKSATAGTEKNNAERHTAADPYWVQSVQGKIDNLKLITTTLKLQDKITNVAVELVKLVEKNREARSKVDTPLLAACVFQACKLTNLPRTIKEIVQVTGIKTTEFSRANKRLIKLQMAETLARESVNHAPVAQPVSVEQPILGAERRNNIKLAKISSEKKSGTCERVYALIEKHYQQLNMTYSQVTALKPHIQVLANLMEGKRPVTIAGICLIRNANIPLTTVCAVFAIAKKTLDRAVKELK
jgi:hypothetical protein